MSPSLIASRYPYSKLKGPNVQGTLVAIEFCAIGRPKTFVFVSSTAVLDNDHYVQLSDKLCAEGKAGIPESDDLEGSSSGLGKANQMRRRIYLTETGIGYGQVKWVSEYLTREAGRRGLRGSIVRYFIFMIFFIWILLIIEGLVTSAGILRQAVIDCPKFPLNRSLTCVSDQHGRLPRSNAQRCGARSCPQNADRSVLIQHT